MIIIFDLDDTLYPEITFVKSGIREVSIFLSQEFNLSSSKLQNYMIDYLSKYGRSEMFNNVLSLHNLNKKHIVNKCLSIYRSHSPKIKLYQDAISCLDLLKDYKKYLVTDGNVLVQRNKIEALGIKKYFIQTIPTYQYGVKYSKPSIYCFELIRKKEFGINPSCILYVGDNPHKDFVNIKANGYRTIRVLTGAYKDVKLDNKFEAEFTINTLKDLTPEFIKNTENEDSKYRN